VNAVADDDPDALVTLIAAASEFEAQTIVAILKEREVDAVAFPSVTQTLGFDGLGGSPVGGVPVQVRRRDVERATSALRANRFFADSVDWDAVEVGEEDPTAQRLGAKGPVLAFGRIMVACGAVAFALIAAFTLIGLLRQCV
jgi:hypothetical protein